MKRKLQVLVISMLTASSTMAQMPATQGAGATSSNDWSRSGNLQTTNGNIFGTLWNSPIYTVTGGISPVNLRSKLNAVYTSTNQYIINNYGWGAGVNTTGYMLLGQSNNSMANTSSNIYSHKGAFSLLHLNGEGSVFQEYGYRPWMKTGVTFTGNKDLSYFGLRKLSTITTEEDLTETVIMWSDNSTSDATEGPDKLVFRFSGYGGSDGSGVSSNRLSNTDLDALHVAQFTGLGLMGLGNTFGTNATGMTAASYIDPQSLLHLSYDWRSGTTYQPYGFMQITYRGTSLGQGETANDGLRVGIDNTMINSGLNGYLRWQEITPFIIQTDWDNTPGGINNGERMRISSTNAPGVPATMMNLTNTTRVAISYVGSIPLTEPRALLHLGANNNTTAVANWMDFGTLVSNAQDAVFIGLTPTNYSDPNQSAIGFGGTDLVFIESGDVEVARIDAATNNVGIGDFSPTGPNTTGIDILDAKLDIDGDLRIRTVTQDNSLTRVLVIDPTDNNRVHYANITSSGNGFTDCADNTGAANLLVDSKINLNNQNLFFENNDVLGQNHIGVGYDCGSALPGKMSAFQTHPTTVNQSSAAFYGRNSDVTNTAGTGHSAFQGIADGTQPIGTFSQNFGGNFEATNGTTNTGVFGYANGTSVSTSDNTAGVFRAVDGANSTGARASATSASNLNYGLMATGFGGNNSYGVYAVASGSSVSNTAGYFSGDVVANGSILSTSDQQFKTDIQDLQSTLEVVSRLKPKSFLFDTVSFPEFHFGSEKQYGFIAQELEQLLPEVVHTKVNPAMYDELGNELTPQIKYKSVNYSAIIPINTEAIIELNQKVEKATLSDQSIKTNINDLSGSLQKVLAMRGVSYDWNQTTQPELQLDNLNHVGFIAQEMQLIDSRLTYLDQDSLLHIEYDKVVPILAEALEEMNNHIQNQDSIITAQQNQMEDINERLKNLENCLSGILPFLCQLNNSAIEQNEEETQKQLKRIVEVQLSNQNSIVLNQNVPNPFAESTIITYSVPTTVGRAQIHFYDMNGILINSVEITERGEGQLNVYGNDLSSGVYTYSLVVDGTVVSTKKMMKN